MGQGHSAVATSERKRLVFIGLGDAALYTISQLYDLKHRAFDIVAVTPRPALDSGQDLGLRLTNLDLMRKYAKTAEYSQLPQLDAVTIVHGLVTAVDAEHKTIMIQRADGTSHEEAYDALVVATGVRNSFWRPNTISTLESRNAQLQRNLDRVARAHVVAVLGGGGAGVSACWSIKEKFPGKAVHLFFSGTQVLPAFNASTRASVMRRLGDLGVVLHGNQRAVVPEGFDLGDMTETGKVAFTDASPLGEFDADLAIWALGPRGANTGFLPRDLLTEDGFVRVDKHLRVVGHTDVFSVGDCADSDADRSSARNYGWKVLAKNITLLFRGVTAADSLATYKPQGVRWGSVFLSAVDSRMVLGSPGGSLTTLPGWMVKHLIMKFIVFRTMLRATPRPRPPPGTSHTSKI